eukprot:GEMP01003218.1.p1 GENE.GEMP01003218.1~~GEMP01003218.1.p1  ORF type:complete len:818 (+),score=214.95 GEMP01003218.1:41-2494(+)
MGFFADAGKIEGVEVWRLEKMTPVKWSRLGEFYSGDCYIVLHTIKPRSRYDLFYWLGKDSTVDEQGGIAYSAVELDQSLGDVPVQYREVQDHETGGFVALWKNHGGLRYLEGGVDSAFHHVTPEEYKPRLLHVKGKRSARVREVKCSAESLNDGDAFILDAGMTLYLWNGKNVNKYEKVKAMEAQRFICHDRKGLPQVVVMAEANTDKLADFWSLLGGEQPIKPAEDGTDELCDRTQAKDLQLFTLQEGAWEPSGLTAPFARKDLPSTCIHLLDTNSPTGLFVWIGNESPVGLRKTAMQLADEWLRKNGRSHGTSICRLQEGSETALFKTMFHQLEVPRPKRWSQMASVASMRESEVNIAAMHQERTQAKVLAARDRKEETIAIWRVNNFDLVEVPVEQHGEFYDGDSYIIEYIYRPKHARGEAVLYFWQGKHSTVDEIGASAMCVTRLDNERHQGRAVQVRVPMGKEPLDFLLIFQGKMIIHQGGVISGFRRSGHATTDDCGQNEPAVRLYHVHGASPQECKAVQVHPTAASLNSNDVFLLIHAASASTPPTLWKGRGASLQEEQLGQELAERIAGGPPQVVAEGSEEEEFWTALGGLTEYASDPAMCDPLFMARLFHISNATGALRCEEVFNFTQVDLLEEDVILLDVKTSVFVWIGNLAHKDEIANAPKIAKEYIATCPDNRGDIPVVVVRQGTEPLLFTCHFNWSEDTVQRLSSRTSVAPEKEAAQVPQLLANGGSVAPKKDQAKMSDQVEEPKDFYPLERLQNETPPGVPAGQKENFLSQEDFALAFNMSKKDFEALAAWKKKDLKKKLGLF